MKLLNKTNEYYIAVAIALLFVGSFVIANRVLYLVNKEINERIIFEKTELENQLASQPQLANSGMIVGDRIEVTPIEKLQTTGVRLKDTVRYDPYEEHIVPYRQLLYEKQINNKTYRIKILKRLPEVKDMFRGLLITIGLITIDVIFCFYFLNRWFSRKIWSPFYNALDVLKNFDLRKGGNVTFKKSSVEEFNAMNHELSKLMDKVSSDYQNLKEYTENTSHEIQTPLAIIHSRLELLMQSESLSDQQMQMIQGTLEACNRLSRMSKGLALLSKIENRQFETRTKFNLKTYIEKKTEEFSFFIQAKNITVTTDIDPALNVELNSELVDILFTNLFSNAIKYNVVNGTIHIKIIPGQLVFSNSGAPLSIEPDQLFERFRKGHKSDSLGLGLAIVEKICEYGSFQIKYSYVNNQHTFTITPIEQPSDEEQGGIF